MRLRFALFLVSAAILACAAPTDSGTSADPDDTSGGGNDTSGGDDTGGGENGNVVRMETTLGTITIEVDPENAPITAPNFLTYVDEGFFDGDDDKGATTFHRVISGFMAQGGGYTSSGAEKETHDPIKLEADNGLSNLRGTIAMARTNAPNSATSQFFINVVDNTFLDAGAGSDGYAVFGEVTDGMDVVDEIVSVAVDGNDGPLETIEITDCERE